MRRSTGAGLHIADANIGPGWAASTDFVEHLANGAGDGIEDGKRTVVEQLDPHPLGIGAVEPGPAS